LKKSSTKEEPLSTYKESNKLEEIEEQSSVSEDDDYDDEIKEKIKGPGYLERRNTLLASSPFDELNSNSRFKFERKHGKKESELI
jgi:hypothetical protein